MIGNRTVDFQEALTLRFEVICSDGVNLYAQFTPVFCRGHRHT